MFDIKNKISYFNDGPKTNLLASILGHGVINKPGDSVSNMSIAIKVMDENDEDYIAASIGNAIVSGKVALPNNFDSKVYDEQPLQAIEDNIDINDEEECILVVIDEQAFNFIRGKGSDIELSDEDVIIEIGYYVLENANKEELANIIVDSEIYNNRNKLANNIGMRMLSTYVELFYSLKYIEFNVLPGLPDELPITQIENIQQALLSLSNNKWLSEETGNQIFSDIFYAILNKGSACQKCQYMQKEGMSFEQARMEVSEFTDKPTSELEDWNANYIRQHCKKELLRTNVKGCKPSSAINILKFILSYEIREHTGRPHYKEIQDFLHEQNIVPAGSQSTESFSRHIRNLNYDDIMQTLSSLSTVNGEVIPSIEKVCFEAGKLPGAYKFLELYIEWTEKFDYSRNKNRN